MTDDAHSLRYMRRLDGKRDPADVVRDAWSAGASVSLDGIGYGRINWDNEQDIVTDASDWPYYQFLAGLAMLLDAKSALEIGTHWGGSARALARGMNGGKVVTI